MNKTISDLVRKAKPNDNEEKNKNLNWFNLKNFLKNRYPSNKKKHAGIELRDVLE